MKCCLSFTVNVFFLSLIIVGFSCKRNNSTSPENVVYYYPAINVYYDSLQATYYYSLNGGNSWDSMAFKQPGFGLIAGERITIEKNGDSIWMDNELHREQYNGKLLNLINNKTIQLSRADSINKTRPVVIAKQQPQEVKKEEPPKKGLKKLFNKLFGKKKKPNEEKKQ